MTTTMAVTAVLDEFFMLISARTDTLRLRPTVFGASSEARGRGKTPTFALCATVATLRLQSGAKDGGERGIRTPGPVSEPTVFKTAALNHSAISPCEHAC